MIDSSANRDSHSQMMPQALPRRVSIDVIDRFDPAEFERRHVAVRRPAVIRGIRWRAFERWNFEYLSTVVPDRSVSVFTDLPASGNVYTVASPPRQQRMTYAEFIAFLSSSERESPCYMIIDMPRPPKEAAYSEYGAYSLFRDFAFQDMCSQAAHVYPNNSKLLLGSEGTRSGWHYDSCDNLLAQVIGSKHVLLGAPGDPAAFYPRASTINNSEVDADAPDLERFPRYAATTLHEATLRPGDIIFNPAGWWHSFRSLETSVSVSWVFGEWLPWRHHLKVLVAGGMRSLAHVSRDLVVNGLLRVPYHRDLYSNRRFGEDVYWWLVDTVPWLFSRKS